MAKKTNKHQERKSANTAALTGMVLAVFIALSAANVAEQGLRCPCAACFSRSVL